MTQSPSVAQNPSLRHLVGQETITRSLAASNSNIHLPAGDPYQNGLLLGEDPSAAFGFPGCLNGPQLRLRGPVFPFRFGGPGRPPRNVQVPFVIGGETEDTRHRIGGLLGRGGTQRFGSIAGTTDNLAAWGPGGICGKRADPVSAGARPGFKLY